MSKKWFKSLILQNFQSHRYSHLTFIEGLNVLVGSSDAGKTSILRALKWVLYNEPSGMAFMTKGAKETKVTLEMNDGTIISRTRSSSKNRYELILPEEKPLIYEGFGTQVPLEIQQATGVFPITVGSNENHMINLAEQLEGPFLLSETGAVRAMAIGKLIGVDIVDEAQKELRRDQDRLKSKEKMISDEIRRLEEELAPFDTLQTEENCFEQAQRITERLDFLTSNLLTYEKFLQEEHDLSQGEKKVAQELTRYQHLDELLLMIKNLKNLHEKLNLSQHLKDELESITKEIQSLTAQMKTFPNFLDLEWDMLSLNKLWRQLHQLEDLQSAYLPTQRAYFALEQELEMLKDLDIIVNMARQVQQDSVQFDHLAQIGESMRAVNESLLKGKTYLAPLAHIDAASAMCADLNLYQERLRLLLNLQNSLAEVMQQEKHFNAILEREEVGIKKLGIELEGAWSQAEICPWCHQPVDSAHIHQLVETL